MSELKLTLRHSTDSHCHHFWQSVTTCVLPSITCGQVNVDGKSVPNNLRVAELSGLSNLNTGNGESTASYRRKATVEGLLLVEPDRVRGAARRAKLDSSMAQLVWSVPA